MTIEWITQSVSMRADGSVQEAMLLAVAEGGQAVAYVHVEGDAGGVSMGLVDSAGLTAPSHRGLSDVEAAKKIILEQYEEKAARRVAQALDDRWRDE